MTPLQEDYRVSLEAFHGPLDLLLYLIRRAEVDIHDIPIASITEQYIVFLGQVDEIDVDLAAEFLVLAATLVEVKSRMIAPPEAATGGEGDDGSAAGLASAVDPRQELVQQLLAYQRVRVASEELEHRRQEFLRRFALRPARGQEIPLPESEELELEDAHALDLSDAYERIMASIDLTRLGDHRIELDDTPIELHEEDLLDRLGRAPQLQLTLQESFDGRTSGERVGLFLATLELTRMRRITIRQDEIRDPIVLRLNEDPADVIVVETDAINRHAPAVTTHDLAEGDANEHAAGAEASASAG